MQSTTPTSCKTCQVVMNIPSLYSDLYMNYRNRGYCLLCQAESGDLDATIKLFKSVRKMRGERPLPQNLGERPLPQNPLRGGTPPVPLTLSASGQQLISPTPMPTSTWFDWLKS